MTKHNNSVEILAPCGSYDILVAAVKAGANACYIGGNKFGARAYATNLADDSILKAIDYAHLHNVKLYLTVNTLLKNSEINELYNYLLPYYEAGLDAVIVQDLGVLDYIRNTFPDLPIHCSTQMNVNSVHGASLMKKLGATRVVTAREMQLDEIRQIKECVDIEVESFVHGAMCYSYSGQCLMSSIAGGRSGNRGRCAQPCRKCYDGSYLLSMKDMCSLELIPDLIESGIDSLKIEGRMKNEYYVASAVSAYRELVDDYYAGCFDNSKAIRLKDRLASIYNRGGFCQSYYYNHNGKDMISLFRPNNQGVLVGKLISVGNGDISIRLSRDLHYQDVLEIQKKDNTGFDLTSGKTGKKGDIITLNSPKTKEIVVGQDVYRTRCNKYINEIDSNILNKTIKLPINGAFCAHIGEKMSFELSLLNESAKVYSDMQIEPSKNRPVDIDSIRDKLSMFGNTDYELKNLDLDVDSDAFVPAGILKQLRRDCISLLEEKICTSYRRTKDTIPFQVEDLIRDRKEYNIANDVQHAKESLYSDSITLPIYVGISGVEQFCEVACYNIQGIYVQRSIYDDIIKKVDSMSLNLKIFIELPYIINADFDLISYLPEKYDGIYIRNIDGYAAYLKNKTQFADKTIVISSSLYAYNDYARYFLNDDNIVFENPKELNISELSGIMPYKSQLTIYEYQQVMLSAQCVICNTEGCDRSNRIKKITDDKKNDFFAKAKCDECCNLIYNGLPTSLIGKIDNNIISSTNSESLRINFTIESADQVRDIMNAYYNNTMLNNTTTGHFYRGVE